MKKTSKKITSLKKLNEVALNFNDTPKILAGSVTEVEARSKLFWKCTSTCTAYCK